MGKTFKKGGVHPPEMKNLSESLALEVFPVPNKLIIPVSQHIGAPAKVHVAVGDAVLKGQVIAVATGFVSVPIHSPVSGKIVGIEKRQTPLNQFVDHIIIENDQQEKWAEGLNIERDWKQMDTKSMVDAIRDNGVVGMGGATFPTHVKLSPPEGVKIDTFILNGVECEPFLTCDHRLMLERTEGILEGMRIMMKILGVKKGYIGIEANKPDAIKIMKDAVVGDPSLEVIALKVKYPQGAEKQLIDAILGREVPPGKLPLDVGVVVNNVGTASAVYEAVCKNRPLIERAVTVSGDGVDKPANLLVRIGTTIGELLEHQGIKSKIKKVVLGGPMMGISVFNPELPVVKGTSGILALEKIGSYTEGPCIRCGRCIEVCPLSGMAVDMLNAIKSGNVDKYMDVHVLDCVECGTCSYICPARRPIVQYVKRAKAELAALRAKKKDK